MKKISEGDRSIRGRQLKKYQRCKVRGTEPQRGSATVELNYQRATVEKISEGDRSIRVTEVSDGDS